MASKIYGTTCIKESIAILYAILHNIPITVVFIQCIFSPKIHFLLKEILYVITCKKISNLLMIFSSCNYIFTASVAS